MIYTNNEDRQSKLVVVPDGSIRRVNKDAEPGVGGYPEHWVEVSLVLRNLNEPLRCMVEALVNEVQELRDAVPSAALKIRF